MRGDGRVAVAGGADGSPLLSCDIGGRSLTRIVTKLEIMCGSVLSQRGEFSPSCSYPPGPSASLRSAQDDGVSGDMGKRQSNDSVS